MTSALATDPDFVAVAKAVWGPRVDVAELAKSVDPADVHMDGEERAARSRRRKLAAGLLAGAAIEGFAAKDTVQPLTRAVRAARPAVREAKTVGGKAKAVKPLVAGPKGKHLPSRGPATNALLQGGNFAVGLGAAKELVHPKKPKQPVDKALRIRLKPINPQDIVRRPSLKARRPAGSPKVVAKSLSTDRLRAFSASAGLHPLERVTHHERTAQHFAKLRYGSGGSRFDAAASHETASLQRDAAVKHARAAGHSPREIQTALEVAHVAKRRRPKPASMYRNVKATTANAAKVSEDAAKISGKVRRLVPNRPAAAAIGVGGIAALGAANGLATYEGAKRGTKAALAKYDLGADVEISKVGDKQQVFGWANVSTWNGQPVLDRQGDVIDIDELEKAAYDYVLDSRIGGDQHRRTPVVKFEGAPLHTADVIESMVFTPEKIEKMGLPPDFPQAWWIGMQIHDPEVWELVKSGKRTGFSVHGTGRRTPIEKNGDMQEALQRRAKGKGKAQLATRTRQAIKPPPVPRVGVDSSAMSSVGYQPQTHRLAVEMKSRPGKPYEYKVDRDTAERVLTAPSKGRAYTQLVRGQAKRVPPGKRYTPADRARLFIHPQDEDVQKADRHPIRRGATYGAAAGGAGMVGMMGAGARHAVKTGNDPDIKAIRHAWRGGRSSKAKVVGGLAAGTVMAAGLGAAAGGAAGAAGGAGVAGARKIKARRES